MPNRIIKESICASDTIDRLSWFEEVFFYRLMVNVDDYGRFDARTAILKARLFPLKSSVTEKQIEQAIERLNESGILISYMVDGKPYLQLPTWEKHQTVRNHKSKYPSADERDEIATESSCKQLNANVPVIQSNTIRNPYPNPNPDTGTSANAFGVFWDAYPRKTAKPNAEKAWKKLNPDAELLDTILKAIEKHKVCEQWTKDGGQFIPHPATWINGKRWEDEVVTGRTGKVLNFQNYNQGPQPDCSAETGIDLLAEARAMHGAQA